MKRMEGLGRGEEMGCTKNFTFLCTGHLVFDCSVNARVFGDEVTGPGELWQ